MSIPISARSGTELTLIPPCNVPDVQRGRTHHRVPSDIEIEALKPADGARGSVDGVNTLAGMEP
jgi:hypothetical protein